MHLTKSFLLSVLVKSKLMPVEKYLFKEKKCIDMKGIAIQTVLMLLVGILVVGIVVYMVYRYIFAPPLSIQECRAQFVSWCTTCKATGFVGGFEMGPTLTDCVNKHGFCPDKSCASTNDCDEHTTADTASIYNNETACPTVGVSP